MTRADDPHSEIDADPAAEACTGTEGLFDVAPAGAICEGHAVEFEARGRRFLVCRRAGEFFAVADRCTHAAWRFSNGSLLAGELVCPLHGGRFDVSTGRATCPPASKPLRTYAVVVRNGRILVDVPPPID